MPETVAQAPMSAGATEASSSAWLFPVAALAVGGAAFAYLVFGLKLAPDAPTIAMASVVVLLMVALRQLFLVVYALGFESAELWADAADFSGGVVSETRAEYRRVLKAIKQLDEDYEVGKLADADHKSLREDLTLKAVELKRQLKSAEGSTDLHPELAARLQGLPVEGTPVEAGASVIVCPSCELENDHDARFCKGCGATLGEADSSEEASA